MLLVGSGLLTLARLRYEEKRKALLDKALARGMKNWKKGKRIDPAKLAEARRNLAKRDLERQRNRRRDRRPAGRRLPASRRPVAQHVLHQLGRAHDRQADVQPRQLRA